mmetsp:Transcript_19067/g.26413  ORF Transcript_19067/g.26413 Transcript_19067/m.26413 type:complete len:150 (-) Transcript_19067:66-515(-)
MKLSAIMLASMCVASASAFAFAGRQSASALGRSATAAAKTSSINTVRMMSASPLDFAKSEIESNDVVVFSKSTCPFCTRTKRLMNDMEAGAKVIEINELDNGADVQAALLEISGQRTVPNVFIKGKHVGGNDDCQALAKSGELAKMISE